MRAADDSVFIDYNGADRNLAPGTASFVAFAAWDGAAGDRNGQKSITAWIPLEVAE